MMMSISLSLSQTKNILICQTHDVFIDMYYLVCQVLHYVFVFTKICLFDEDEHSF